MFVGGDCWCGLLVVFVLLLFWVVVLVLGGGRLGFFVEWGDLGSILSYVGVVWCGLFVSVFVLAVLGGVVVFGLVCYVFSFRVS